MLKQAFIGIALLSVVCAGAALPFAGIPALVIGKKLWAQLTNKKQEVVS